MGFPNNGIDTCHDMAKKGMFIIDRVVQEQMGGGVDLKKGVWYILDNGLNIQVGK